MMLNTLKLEALKVKRTSTFKLVLVIPFFTVSISAVLAPGFLIQNSFNWWYTLLYPLLTALICSTIFGKLDKNADFQTLFLSRVHQGKFFIAKCVVSGGLLFISSVLYSSLLFLLTIFFPTEFDYFQIVVATLVTWLGYLFLIPLCGVLMLYLPSLLVTVCIIIATEAMQIFYEQFTMWQINPFVIPAVLMTTIINTLPNGLLNDGILDLLSIQMMSLSLVISIIYLLAMGCAGSGLLQRKAER